MPTKNQRNNISFPYAIQSFIGYLEGTKKSAHTVKNYRLDLLAFQNFMQLEYGGKAVKLEEVSPGDLQRYRFYLKEKGFKTNTRRRKILTVTQFLAYLFRRKKVSPDVAKKIPAPHKVERIPFTVCSEQLVQAIGDLPTDTLIDARNRVLLWTLAETGCLVSEVTEIKFEHWSRNGASQAMVQIPGKSERLIPVSSELFFAIQQLKEKCASGKAIPSWIFLGFNKYGSLGAPISARGVELLVKLYSKKLGFSDLTPRIFRHSVILRWFEEGVSPKEIQSWLGLKTTYAFRSYEPLLIKSNSGTTSNAEKSSRES